MKRLISAFLITAASTLAVPAIVSAAPAGAEGDGARVVIRVYDPYRHDYHSWDRDEQRAYREYLAARHRRYVAYQQQRAAERRAYWRWRHEREERIEHER